MSVFELFGLDSGRYYDEGANEKLRVAGSATHSVVPRSDGPSVLTLNHLFMPESMEASKSMRLVVVDVDNWYRYRWYW